MCRRWTADKEKVCELRTKAFTIFHEHARRTETIGGSRFRRSNSLSRRGTKLGGGDAPVQGDFLVSIETRQRRNAIFNEGFSRARFLYSGIISPFRFHFFRRPTQCRLRKCDYSMTDFAGGVRSKKPTKADAPGLCELDRSHAQALVDEGAGRPLFRICLISEAEERQTRFVR